MLDTSDVAAVVIVVGIVDVIVVDDTDDSVPVVVISDCKLFCWACCWAMLPIPQYDGNKVLLVFTVDEYVADDADVCND